MSAVIYGNGSPNLSNFAPGVVVDVQPVQPSIIQGVSTNTIVAVGTATFGPVNQQVPIQDYADYVGNFGNLTTTDLFDLGSFVYLAQQKYANNFILVRVTDGTDLMATGNLVDISSLPATGVILTCKYSGVTGNQLQAVMSAGSNSSPSALTYKLSLNLPGIGFAEVFDNIGGTGATFWANLVAAVNTGLNQNNGPSQLVIASLNTKLAGATITNGGTGYTTAPTVGFTGGTGTPATATATVTGGVVTAINFTSYGNYTVQPTGITFTGGGGSGAAATPLLGSASAPALTSIYLSGGTNGNSGVTSSTLVGADTTPATGMYVLRNSGVGVGALPGCTDASTFGAQATFGLQEGKRMFGSGPSGQTTAQAIAVMQSSGVATSSFKYLVGDFEYWLDDVNNVYRYSTQQAAACALYSTLNPPQSGLNQPINVTATMATQRSIANKPYGDEIKSLFNAGIDVIALNRNLGNYFAMQTGNMSNYPVVNDIAGMDNYASLTPYLAFSLRNGLAQFIGQLLDPQQEQLAFVITTNFLQQLAQPPYVWIGDVNGGKAFAVTTQAQDTTLIVNVYVVMFNVIVNVLVNLYNGVTQINNPVPATAQNRKRLNLL